MPELEPMNEEQLNEAEQALTVRHEQLSAVPENSETWIERLKNTDPKDHLGTIVSVGAAALAIGVGVYELKKRGKKISIGFADRRFEKEGVISVVERTEKGGLAVGAAVTKAALEALGKSKDVFAMEDMDVAYPLEREGDAEPAARRARKVAGWLIDILAGHARKVEK